MKEVKNYSAQGDVWFIRVDKVPEGYFVENTTKEVIVAHSETGHHHVAVATAPFVFFTNPQDPMRSYIKTRGSIDIVHKRGFDTHETQRLLDTGNETIWEIRRQREGTNAFWRPSLD